jgi:hypothetical protein
VNKSGIRRSAPESAFGESLNRGEAQCSQREFVEPSILCYWEDAGIMGTSVDVSSFPNVAQRVPGWFGLLDRRGTDGFKRFSGEGGSEASH